MENRNLSLLPALTAVAFVMAARGAFADKVVALPSLPEAGLPNSEMTTNIALNVNCEKCKMENVNWGWQHLIHLSR